MAVAAWIDVVTALSVLLLQSKINPSNVAIVLSSPYIILNFN